MERLREPMSPDILMSKTRRQEEFVRKTIENAQAMASDTNRLDRPAWPAESVLLDSDPLAGR